MNHRRVLGVAGLLLATGVVAGALGAHALRGILEPRSLETLQTAVHYQLVNSLGLLAIGILMRQDGTPMLGRVAWLLIAGIFCFSGSLYLMLAGAPFPVPLITPVGGVLLIVAWTWFGVSMLRRGAGS